MFCIYLNRLPLYKIIQLMYKFNLKLSTNKKALISFQWEIKRSRKIHNEQKKHLGVRKVSARRFPTFSIINKSESNFNFSKNYQKCSKFWFINENINFWREIKLCYTFLEPRRTGKYNKPPTNANPKKTTRKFFVHSKGVVIQIFTKNDRNATHVHYVHNYDLN